MYSEAELNGFLDELSQGKHSYQNCERMAAVYTVLDHIKDDKKVVGNYGESEFLQAVCSKDEQEVFWLLDELLAITKEISPKLYNSFIAKVEGII